MKLKRLLAKSFALIPFIMLHFLRNFSKAPPFITIINFTGNDCIKKTVFSGQCRMKDLNLPITIDLIFNP
jgi:hypothetical protein